MPTNPIIQIIWSGRLMCAAPPRFKKNLPQSDFRAETRFSRDPLNFSSWKRIIVCVLGVTWFAISNSAYAQNECGTAPSGSAVAELVCNPDNYDPATDGNIYYRLEGSTNYNVKLIDLSGEKAIQINSGDSHVYFPARPSGVWIEHRGLGTISAVANGIKLTTSEASQRGINFTIYGDTATASSTRRPLSFEISNSEFNTVARAIQATHTGTGSIRLNAMDVQVKTTGANGYGIVGWHDANGDVSVNVDRVNIEMAGASGRGVYGRIHNSIKFNKLTDDGADKTVLLKIKDSNIRGMEANTYGILAWHNGAGKIDISVSGSQVNVAKANSYGIFARHYINTGNAAVSSSQNANMDISINVVDSRVTSAESHGILVQRVNHAAIRPDSTGTNRITIGPNSKIIAKGVGILTQVVNGATGTLQISGKDIITIEQDAEVKATGTLAGIQVGSADSLITVKGLVSAPTNAVLNAGQRMKVHILGSGRIDGAISNLAASGMIDIQVGKDLLVRNNVIRKKTGHTSVYDTTVREATAEEIGKLGGILGSAFYTHSVLAPRAAVYEVVPSVLLLDRQNIIAYPSSVSVISPNSSRDYWIRLRGGTGSHKAKQSTVGAKFRFNRLTAEIGTEIPMTNDSLSGSAGLELSKARAKVSSPIGGGRIGTQGLGLFFGLDWRGANGYYSSGRLSSTFYSMDISSDKQDRLASNVDATVYSLDIEAGRQFVRNQRTRLTARTWLGYSRVSMDSFTDKVGAEVGLRKTRPIVVGIGGKFETDRAMKGGTLSLSGALGYEHLSNRETEVSVSGEKLKSELSDGVSLSLGATYHGSRYKLLGTLQSRGLGSKGREHSVNIALQIPFN